MSSSPHEIRKAIDAYFDLLNAPVGDVEADLVELADALDRLILLARHAPDVFDDQPDPPDSDHRHLVSLASTRFPSLGHYNKPGYISRSVGATDCVVGDAIDDVSDIAGDLAEVLWCFENTTEEDAIWHFRFGYQYHWGKHAADLRWYLFAVAREY